MTIKIPKAAISQQPQTPKRDQDNYYVAKAKATAIWYDQYIGIDLWWMMVLLSIALFLNTLVLAILIWRKYPRLGQENMMVAV